MMQKSEVFLAFLNIHIKDNEEDGFCDVDCIVEFMLLTNEYNTTPYYVDASSLRFVVVKKDGTTAVQHTNPLMLGIKANGSEFSNIVENVSELDGSFNRVLEL